MLKSKEKAFLKTYAHSHDLIKINIGKDLINKSVIENIQNALIKHEILKISFLNTIVEDKTKLNEYIIELVQILNCEVVQKIGHTIIIYKENKKSPLHIEIK